MVKTFSAVSLPLVLLACFLGQAMLSLQNTLWGAMLYLAAAVLLFATRGAFIPPAWLASPKRGAPPSSLVVMVLLCLWSATFLFYKLGSFPDVLYNWEVYTVHGLLEYMARPLELLRDSYLWNEAWMTLSQRSLFVAGPILAAWKLLGVGLFQLRIVAAIYGVLSVLVFYKLAEEHFGRLVAMVSTIMLSVSPVFLLYSRTATNVGPTILASLLVVYFFAGALSGRKLCFPLLGFFLGIASYYYKVIRFIPLSVVFIMVVLLLLRRVPLRENRWPLFLMVAILLLTVSPQLLQPQNLVRSFLSARGEQVAEMWKEPWFVKQYAPEIEADPSGLNAKLRAAWALVKRNATDYATLYLSIKRSPVFRDYWNPRGEILAPYLVPFLVLGFLYCLAHIREGRCLLLVLWFAVTSLPILLTNNVHAGRLVLSLPPMFILVALGMAMAFSALPRLAGAGPLVLRVCLGAFLLFVVCDGVRDYFGFSERPQTHAKRIANFLDRRGGESDAYIFSKLSGLEAAELNFYTYYDYNFAYYHQNFGTGFAATAPEILGRKAIHFYNVSPSAAALRLNLLRDILSRPERSYIVMDKETYSLAKDLPWATMRLEEETDFLYLFSTVAKGP